MKKYSLTNMMLDLEETDNHEDYENIVFRFLDKNDLFFKIGRASCRERV